MRGRGVYRRRWHRGPRKVRIPLRFAGTVNVTFGRIALHHAGTAGAVHRAAACRAGSDAQHAQTAGARGRYAGEG